MRAALVATAFTLVLVFHLGAGPAFAADKDPAKAAKAEKKPAAEEVTLNGEMVCAKCVLHETKQCQNVLKVAEGGSETKYYLAQNKTAKDNHEQVCSGAAKATVTGKVSEKAGKKVLTASSIKYQ
jgi:hypothetical protein